MNSKKGALFHWIIFGVLAAMGAFALIMYNSETAVTVKGTWQLDFLDHYYLEGEKSLASFDLVALQVGRKAILSLAKKGGFADTPSCGSYGEVIYWNKGKNFCFLNVDKELTAEFNSLYAGYDPDWTYSLSRQGEEVLGKTEKDLIIGQGKKYDLLFPKRSQQYMLKPHFKIDLDYSFDEYFLLQDQAKKLIDECKSADNLQDCLEKIKPSHWKFSSCEDEKFVEQERRVVFCAESPSQYVVHENGKPIPVQYKLGLDFSRV